MTRTVLLTLVGLTMLLNITSVWGDTGTVYFDASDNTGAGQTLFNGTFTGVSNTALGRAMLLNLTSGSRNPATGTSALASTTSGFNNTATGFQALQDNTTGGNKDDAKATLHYGLVAEEVASVYPHLVTYAPTGEVRAVKYQELIPMLLNELQRQQRELAEVTKLRAELAELRALVGSRLETRATE